MRIRSDHTAGRV